MPNCKLQKQERRLELLVLRSWWKLMSNRLNSLRTLRRVTFLACNVLYLGHPIWERHRLWACQCWLDALNISKPPVKMAALPANLGPRRDWTLWRQPAGHETTSASLYRLGWPICGLCSTSRCNGNALAALTSRIYRSRPNTP